MVNRRFALKCIDRAEKALIEGETKAAEEHLDAAEDAASGYGPLHARLGQVLLERYAPPRLDEAVRDFTTAIEEGEKPGAKPYYTWLAHDGRGRALEHSGRLDEARKDFLRALEMAPAFGFRRQATEIVSLARIEARRNNISESLRLLERALEIESLFQPREFIEGVAADEAFKDVVKSEDFRARVRTRKERQPPEVQIDPQSDGVSLRSHVTFVLPPVIREKGKRNRDFELSVEKCLRRKLGRRSVAFDKDTRTLARANMDEVSAFLCKRAGNEVVRFGNFSLASYSADREDLGDVLFKVIFCSKGKFKQPPSLVLATTGEIDGGKNIHCTCTFRCCLFSVRDDRTVACVSHTYDCFPEALAGKIKSVGTELVKKLDLALKKRRD
jgi:tetratricopeptide (TPR) repeat protein